MDRSSTHWESAAATRWGRYITEVERRAVDRADALAGPRTEALDVGCEGGRWAERLSRNGWSLTCLDVDADALAACAARCPDARCIQVRPTDTRFPVADAATGLLACIEVHPVTHAAWFPAEVVRVLRPGGVLVTVAWNRMSARGLAAEAVSRLRTGAGHDYYGTSYRRWRAGLVDAGIEILSEEGLCWMPFGRRSDSPLVPAAVALERILGLGRRPRLSPWVVVVARRPAR